MSQLSDNLTGRFVVIDGGDGTGKSTQLKRLASRLRADGLNVCTARDPGGTAIGERIRGVLLDSDHHEMTPVCETMLYMASRAQLVAEVIAPALAAGACVLCDRFVSATIAYQGAGGVDADSIRRVAEVAIGSTRPGLTVILDLPSDVGLGRLDGAPDRMEAKDRRFHQRVREGFLGLAEDDPDHVAVVDAAGSVEQVHRRLCELLAAWPFPERSR